MIISFPDKLGKWQNISRTQYKGLLQLLGTLCQRGTSMGETIHDKSPLHFSPLYLGQEATQALDRILIIVRHAERDITNTLSARNFFL